MINIDLKEWSTRQRAEVYFTSALASFADTKYLEKMSPISVLRGALSLFCPEMRWPVPEDGEDDVMEATKGARGGDNSEEEEGGDDYPSGSDFDASASFSDLEMMEDEEEEDQERMCEQLEEDVRKYREHFGSERLKVDFRMGRDTTAISFIFHPQEYISQATADAWGVHLDLPIVLMIHVSAPRYREMAAPKVEIWQQGAKTSEQEEQEEREAIDDLKRRAEEKYKELLTLHYPTGLPAANKAILEDMVMKSVPGFVYGVVQHPKKRPFNAGRFGLQVQLTTIMNAFLNAHWKEGSALRASLGVAPNSFGAAGGKSASSSLANAAPLTAAEEVILSELKGMGFAPEKAIAAIRVSGGKLDEAVTLLVDPNFSVSTASAFQASSKPSTSANKTPGNPSAPKKRKKKVKAVIDWNLGFLVAFGSFFTQRFATVNDYCVICDELHIGVGALLKPCVCNRDLCCWSLQQLGVGADASSEIATPVDVTDLLVSMVVAAAKSNRNTSILEPFPTIFDPSKAGQDKPSLSPDNKDWALLNEIVQKICNVNSKLRGAWRNDLKAAHPLAWPLLNWITTSNRSHLVRLPPNYLIRSMGTPYQYLLISAPPEKEAIFQKNKKQYGSHWAFHGSGPENWHSILRRGLINASGTTLQLNGAAYGAGIYLSPSSSVSCGYSRLTPGPDPSLADDSGLQVDPLQPHDANHCLALCEVVNHRLRKTGDIWVQEDPDNVVTRIFFVFPKGRVGKASAHSRHTINQADFLQEIDAAAKFYGMHAGMDEFDSDDEE